MMMIMTIRVLAYVSKMYQHERSSRVVQIHKLVVDFVLDVLMSLVCVQLMDSCIVGVVGVVGLVDVVGVDRLYHAVDTEHVHTKQFFHIQL